MSEPSLVRRAARKLPPGIKKRIKAAIGRSVPPVAVPETRSGKGASRPAVIRADETEAQKDRPTQGRNVSLVVVFYERELDMLALLAKSVGRHADAGLVTEIVVVDNSYNQPDLRARFEAKVISEFDKLTDVVRYVHAAELGVSPTSAKDGYTTQQALKLEVSQVVTNEHYLVLDAKNHLISPLERPALFADDGRPKSEFTVFENNYLGRCRQTSFAYWGEEIAFGEESLPTVTPYLMITDVVRAMLSEVRERSGFGVVDLIRENDRRTEFLLYAGFISSTIGMDKAYVAGPRPCATLYTKWPEKDEDVRRVLGTVERPDVYAMGIHARRYPQLTQEHAALVAQQWVGAGLVPDVDSGRELIARQVELHAQPGEQTETEPPDVLIGAGARLAIHVGTNGYLDQHLGKKTIDDEAVARWQRTIEARDSYSRERGIEYGFLIAPDTFSVHAEDFAAAGEDSDDRPVAKLLNDSATTGRVVYPLDALREARSKGIVCHTADSHWSGWGAYVAYRELQRTMPDRLKPLPEDQVKFWHKTGTGDLGDKLNPPAVGEFTECVVRKAQAKPVWNNGVSNRGYMGLWTNPDQTLPRGVLYMDSYGWKLQRFIAESFSSLLVVHTPYYEWYPVDTYQPQVVINLMAERFLIRVPDDHTLEPALVTARQKLPSAAYPSKEAYDSGRVDEEPA